MERSRDGNRGRYRDRHSHFTTNRTNQPDRSTRGNSRGYTPRINESNGNYSSRNSPNDSYNYRSSRISINSRPVSSRNGPPKHHRYQQDDDYPVSTHFSSSSNRANNSVQTHYYDNHSPQSRFDRSSSHRDTYLSSLNEQPILSNSLLPSTSSYYVSSQSMSSIRDRGLPVTSSQHIDSERSRYTSSNYRRNSPPPPLIPSYRNERSMDYGPSRTTNSDVYIRNEYRSVTPPSLNSISIRGDPYGEIYRSNDYPSRSERYDIPSNRNTTSSRDYPMASVSSSSYRNDSYRSSSNVSMSSPSSYVTREQYVQDTNYRSISQSRDYGSTSTRNNYSLPMDHQEGLYRNIRDHTHDDNRFPHRDRQNLKRSGSRYNDDGPIPSKRPMRR